MKIFPFRKHPSFPHNINITKKSQIKSQLSLMTWVWVLPCCEEFDDCHSTPDQGSRFFQCILANSRTPEFLLDRKKLLCSSTRLFRCWPYPPFLDITCEGECPLQNQGSLLVPRVLGFSGRLTARHTTPHHPSHNLTVGPPPRAPRGIPPGSGPNPRHVGRLTALPTWPAGEGPYSVHGKPRGVKPTC